MIDERTPGGKTTGAALARPLPSLPAWVYLALPILYMPVPQTGHVPFVAGLPFFIVTGVASFISRWVRHFRQ